MEQQQRLAAEQRAARDKPAAAERAAVQQGVDPQTEEINRYIVAKFAARLEVYWRGVWLRRCSGPDGGIGRAD